ncbi:hypothetical protein ACHAXA_008957 [Cyclostephanos tholiformis]|uniref:Uncharacterized protein n=1 Tax=Cyclostephanos tholiformis TaxID=382380 RepID=A0ABD3SC42_9STRA
MSETAASDATPRAAANVTDGPKAQARMDDDVRPPSRSTSYRRNLTASASASARRLSRSGRSIRERSSEIFASTLKMFRKTGGREGASVGMLRGDSGSDFEGYATVHRLGISTCNPFSRCPWGGTKNGKHVFLLIKGYHCFVYDDEDGDSPRYAIELIHRRAVLQPSHDSFVPHVPHPGAREDSTYATVNLESSLGDVEYRITLVSSDRDGHHHHHHHHGATTSTDVPSTATRFVDAVTRASAEASNDEVRTRLGHAGLLNGRASVDLRRRSATPRRGISRTRRRAPLRSWRACPSRPVMAEIRSGMRRVGRRGWMEGYTGLCVCVWMIGGDGGVRSVFIVWQIVTIGKKTLVIERPTLFGFYT